ncbi:MAG: sugar O-acetyltransferase [Clostridia bacterium]|nr:sugar O-acetyltransferase [Clostridia bacterium]
MTAKEKQLAGLDYLPDESLANEHLQARQNAFLYNNIPPLNEDERDDFLKKILGGVGENVTVYSPFSFDYGTNITMGNNVFVNSNCVFLDCGRIEIGNNVFIGPQCGLYTPLHPIDAQKRSTGIETAQPVKLCDNVWLGGGVIVLPGVTIGEGSVIGAGSVVTKDVPPNVFACGNPCVVKKEIK